jgi:hypothetical protein
MAVPLELLRRLVVQHRVALAMLLGEIGLAFDKTLASWAEEFPDPMRLHGGTLCSDVRTRVLAMNAIDARSRFDNPPRTPSRSASCGPDSTLQMSSGPGVSVRFGDSDMAFARVRHMSPKEAEALGAVVQQLAMPAPKPGRQMVLDDDEPESQRVMGPPGIGQNWDLVLYWWETPGRLSVAGGILAMVEEIDTSDERIVAFVDLPAAIRPKTAAEIAQQDVEDDEVDREFDEQWPENPSAGEDSGA